MAEYMGEYKIIRKMDGGGNANVFVAENVRGEAVSKFFEKKVVMGKGGKKGIEKREYVLRLKRKW